MTFYHVNLDIENEFECEAQGCTKKCDPKIRRPGPRTRHTYRISVERNWTIMMINGEFIAYCPQCVEDIDIKQVITPRKKCQ